jgi:alpha-glucosidase
VAARVENSGSRRSWHRLRRLEGAPHAPFHTPWRTLQIADTAGGLVESSLILNLNEPNKLGDVSWFKPHKYVGVWWSLHLDSRAGAPAPGTARPRRTRSATSTSRARMASAACWSKAGTWDGTATGSPTAGTSISPRPRRTYDLEALAAYAKSKGVHLIGHHETACAVSHYERQLEQSFSMFERLGIDSVKTGYVCDAGQIERQDTKDGAGRPRMARRPVAGAPPPARGRRQRRSTTSQSTRTSRSRTRACAAPIRTGSRAKAPRHGIQRLGQPAESARARSEPRIHAHACRTDGLHPGRASA